MKYLILIRREPYSLESIIDSVLEEGGTLVGGPFSYVKYETQFNGPPRQENMICQAVLMPDNYDRSTYNNRSTY